MTDRHPVSGIYAAVSTPFDAAAEVVPDRYVAHCNWLLRNGCDGLGILGSTGEANSLTMSERKRLIDAVVNGGIDPARLMPGTGCCALADTIELTKHSVGAGADTVLMLPPFFYKNNSDDGLVEAFSRVIDGVGDSRLKVLLYHFPQTPDQALYQDKFGRFPWRKPDDYADDLRAWQRGHTGIPIVDAGMRELWTTGWMHNRVRMIVASFLTKDLLIDWRWGERFFYDRLVDGDPASNNGGWQWAASTGTDAQPYFRIFNPVSQGKRWDPDGAYVRRWVPELADVPDRHLHAPWEAGLLFSDYPQPIVDHAERREEALDRYQDARERGSSS